MRVDFVITELFVGGAEKCLTELAIGLAAQGDQVRVFSLGSLPEGEQAMLVDRLIDAEIPVESMEAETIWGFYNAFRGLRRAFLENPPDLVQTFLHHANVLGIRAAASAGIATRVAGVRVAEPRMIRSRIERSALRSADSVVCVSRAVLRFAESRLGCRPDQTVVIPNGIELERFSSAGPFRWSQIGWPDDSQVCLFLGRLAPQKGIELLQQEIDRIAPANTPRKLLLVGDGPLRSQVESWSDQIGPKRVQLLPWRSDVAPIICGCRMLVLPSHFEGMPNVVLEAMAASKPVVCSLVEGSEELLAHAAEHQGFAAGEATQMTRLIDSLHADPQLCRDVGAANHDLVKQHFSLTAMTEAYREHYRKLLERRLDEP